MFNFWPFNIARLRRERAARAAMRAYFQSLGDIPVLFEGTAEEYLAWLDRQPPKASKAMALNDPHHPANRPDLRPRQADLGLPKPTRPAPPMPRIKPPREEPRSAQWRDENSTVLRGPSD